MIRRRSSRVLTIGGVEVGGGARVVVQSMTKTDTRDLEATVSQIRRLEESGSELVRVAVPDRVAAESLADIKKRARIPIVADVHFDHRLALAALDAGVDGLRLNPGNIRDADHIAAVARRAKRMSVPIRVGVNAGSLPDSTDQDGTVVERMVKAALEEIRLLESVDFDLIKVSMKAFDVPTTVEAYRAIAGRVPYPLHLGITEAGLPRAGSIRSAVGLGVLLYEGIGDTVRVSLTTSDPCEEVECAYEILKALDLRERGPTLVSCPSCGRSETDIVTLAEEVDRRLQGTGRAIKVAVMGCVVNGPGEARDADVGIACGRGRGVIFRRGEKVRTVDESEFLGALMAEVAELLGDG